MQDEITAPAEVGARLVQDEITPPAEVGARTAPTELKIVTAAEACAILGGSQKPIHRSTLWRGIRDGRYPRPIKIPFNRWIVDELHEVHRAAIVVRDSEIT